MKRKKIILEWDDETNMADYVIGITSSSSHLEFVHFLNKTEYFNMVRCEEFEIPTNSGTIFLIGFKNEDLENKNSYTLIKVRGNGIILGKEFKRVDYLLNGNPENTESLDYIVEILKEQKLIQAITKIPYKKLTETTRKILEL